MAGDEPDVIRLTLPAEDSFRPVVEVATGVLARRCGFNEAARSDARAASGSEFTALLDKSGVDVVEVELRVRPDHLEVRLVRGASERTVTRPLP